MLSAEYNMITSAIKQGYRDAENKYDIYHLASILAENMRRDHRRFSIIKFMRDCGYSQVSAERTEQIVNIRLWESEG